MHGFQMKKVAEGNCKLAGALSAQGNGVLPLEIF